jgi:hypothetical protein
MSKGWHSTISVGGALYSVPSALVDERVWARVDGSELVVVHADGRARSPATSQLTTPGRPSIRDEHYRPRLPGALERRPKAGTLEKQACLSIAETLAGGAASTSGESRKTVTAIACFGRGRRRGDAAGSAL